MGADTKWVLVVDDDVEVVDSIRELLDLTFGPSKLRIIEAHNGMDATTKVKNQKFDCIITDMKMPKKDGDAFIVSARQNPFNEDTPIVMLTGFPNKKILRDYRFVYLLEKPFVHSDLTDLLTTQLKVGNKGDRIAADMVNNLVGAAKTLLTSVLETENFELKSPKAKKPGEDLEANFVSQVNLIDKAIHNSFSIIVEQADLLRLSQKMEHLKDKPLERIAFGFGLSIAKHALSGMRGKSNINHNIITLEGAQAHESLTPKRGIIIPMTCDGIDIKILACGEKKKIVAAA